MDLRWISGGFAKREMAETSRIHRISDESPKKRASAWIFPESRGHTHTPAAIWASILSRRYGHIGELNLRFKVRAGRRTFFGALLDELALNGELEDAVLQFLRGHPTISIRTFFPLLVHMLKEQVILAYPSSLISFSLPTSPAPQVPSRRSSYGQTSEGPR